MSVVDLETKKYTISCMVQGEEYARTDSSLKNILLPTENEGIFPLMRHVLIVHGVIIFPVGSKFNASSLSFSTVFTFIISLLWWI